jgi:hypothetical protein
MLSSAFSQGTEGTFTGHQTGDHEKCGTTLSPPNHAPPYSVIPAKAGIQIFHAREPSRVSSLTAPCHMEPFSLFAEKCTACFLRSRILVSRFRGNDAYRGSVGAVRGSCSLQT